MLTENNLSRKIVQMCNALHISQNFDKFHLFSNRLNYEHSIIGLSETWLKETSPSSLFSMDGFKLITKIEHLKKEVELDFTLQIT